MTIRTFIALEIPDDVITQIIKIRDDTTGKLTNVRWEPKEKLHLTLKFLGDTKKELVGKISDSIEKILENKKNFQLNFSGFGVFTKGRDPKILWVGLNENPRLVELVDEIENTFEEFGYEKEKRKFNAHITLLRIRGHEDLEKILSLTRIKIPEINFTANRITFFESKLLQSGSVYSSLKSFYLKN